MYAVLVSVCPEEYSHIKRLCYGHTRIRHTTGQGLSCVPVCVQRGEPGGAGRGVDGMVALCWSDGSSDRVWHVLGDQSLAVLVADWVSAASGRGQPFVMHCLQQMTRSVF